jgi:hypothetical protein
MQQSQNNQIQTEMSPVSAYIGLAASLLIPSTATIQKYFGILGVTFYIAIASFLLFIGVRWAIAKFSSTITDKQMLWLIALTFFLLLVVFIVGFPLAHSGIFGPGSDRNQALNLATTELLHGRYPYYPKTYLGNPITPLPGSLILAVPFVLLGNSAYQNLFWLLVLLCVMSHRLKDRRQAFLLLWAILALSPVVMQEFVTGGDFLANSVYVLLFVMWVVNAVRQPRLSSWVKSLLAVLLGVGFASRANFILILPLVSAALLHSAGSKAAIRYSATTLLTFILVTAPFYLYDPQNFSPLHTANKLAQFQMILPYAGIIVPLATGIIAILLSLYRTNGNSCTLLRNCSFVLAIPVLSGAILQCIKTATMDLSFTAFGMSFLFFGAMAYWPILFGYRHALSSSDRSVLID